MDHAAAATAAFSRWARPLGSGKLTMDPPAGAFPWRRPHQLQGQGRSVVKDQEFAAGALPRRAQWMRRGGDRPAAASPLRWRRSLRRLPHQLVGQDRHRLHQLNQLGEESGWSGGRHCCAWASRQFTVHRLGDRGRERRGCPHSCFELIS